MIDRVIWPERYDPRISAIYALNDIDVKAPPEDVWQLLVDAEHWSSHFPAEDQVRILSGGPALALGTRFSRVTAGYPMSLVVTECVPGRRLALGTRFSRVTVGYPMSLVVTECVPGRRLAWTTTVDGDDTGSSAYHGWVITATKDGCHLLTEETQQGPFFVELIGRRQPGALYRYHQEWVESLARAAESAAKAGRAG